MQEFSLDLKPIMLEKRFSFTKGHSICNGLRLRIQMYYQEIKFSYKVRHVLDFILKLLWLQFLHIYSLDCVISEYNVNLWLRNSNYLRYVSVENAWALFKLSYLNAIYRTQSFEFASEVFLFELCLIDTWVLSCIVVDESVNILMSHVHELSSISDRTRVFFRI